MQTKAINSAECLRNFLLLCTEKVTQDELFLTEEEKNQDKKQEDSPKKIATRLGEHLYDPDQPRVPAGSPEGGQWTKDGSNSGDTSNDKNSSADKEENSEPKENQEGKSDKANIGKNNTESESFEATQIKIIEELKDRARKDLKEAGYTEEEIERYLAKEFTIISKEENEKMNKIVQESIKDAEDGKIPLVASNGNFADIFLGEMTSETKKSPSTYKAEGVTISSVNEDRTPNNDDVGLEACIKKGSDPKYGGEGVFGAMCLRYKDKNLVPGTKGYFYVEVECQKLELFIEDETYNYIYEKSGEVLKSYILIEAEVDQNHEINSGRFPFSMFLTKIANDSKPLGSTSSIAGEDLTVLAYLIPSEVANKLNTYKENSSFDINDLYIEGSLNKKNKQKIR